jgi:hypothetical protein
MTTWETTVREAAVKALSGDEAVVPSDVANREHVERLVRERLTGFSRDANSGT